MWKSCLQKCEEYSDQRDGFKTLHSQKLRMVQMKVAWMQHAIQS